MVTFADSILKYGKWFTMPTTNRYVHICCDHSSDQIQTSFSHQIGRHRPYYTSLWKFLKYRTWEQDTYALFICIIIHNVNSCKRNSKINRKGKKKKNRSRQPLESYCCCSRTHKWVKCCRQNGKIMGINVCGGKRSTYM